MQPINRQILIAELPKGKLALDHFRLVETPMPVPDEGEVLLRNRYLVIEPAMRAWMLGASYRAALTAGQVMASTALAEVLESRSAGFETGDLVYASDAGCQAYVALPAASLRRLPHLEPVTHLASVYGVAGLTAYFGLLEV